MFGILEVKGHQYRVAPGDIIDIDKADFEVGSIVNFDQVLMIGGKDFMVGKPTVTGAQVSAKVIKQAKSRKQIILVRKPGKYRHKNGHRQSYTSLLITQITDGKGNTAKIEKPTPKVEKLLK